MQMHVCHTPYSSVMLHDTSPSIYSHFWVVVVRMEEKESQQQRISQNISTYSSDIPVNIPYIVAEMSADTYLQSRRFFVLGDENGTRQLNDFPKLYRNGPLLAGSLYTLFVRAFVHPIPPQSSSVSIYIGLCHPKKTTTGGKWDTITISFQFHIP